MKRALIILLVLSNAFQALSQRHRIDSLLHANLQTLNDSVQMKAYYQLAKDYTNISIDSSQLYSKKSIALAIKLKNQKVLADCYSILGVNEKNLGNYEQALIWHFKALKIKEARNDELGMAIAHNDIGIIYKNMKRIDDALVNYKKSNELCIKIDLKKGISMTYNNIGTIYREKAKPDSALFYYDLALKEAEKTGDTYSISTCLANIGDIYTDKEKYIDALAIFQKCLSYDRANEDILGMVSSYNNIARTLGNLKKFNEAIRYSDSAMTITKNEDLKQERLETIMVRMNIEEWNKNYPAAFALQKEFIALKDSLMGVETTNKISELQTKYETEKKEQQITLQQSEIKRKNYMIAGVLGILALSTLLSYSYYRRYQLKQKSKLQAAIIHEQELATNAVIEAEERERKRIAGDLHDGVGQLMSAAKMNLSMVGNELSFHNDEERNAFFKAMDLVDEGCKEVRNVSHNIMPNALLKSGLASAIREFIDKIDQRILKVNLYTEGLNERIDTKIETVLYRIIQESINNVIKHSGASQLDISLIKDKEGISASIEDNGKGFDMNDKNNFNGIGIKNIQSRVDYLKGTVEWDAAIGKGTVVMVHIPVVS